MYLISTAGLPGCSRNPHPAAAAYERQRRQDSTTWVTHCAPTPILAAIAAALWRLLVCVAQAAVCCSLFVGRWLCAGCRCRFKFCMSARSDSECSVDTAVTAAAANEVGQQQRSCCSGLRQWRRRQQQSAAIAASLLSLLSSSFLLLSPFKVTSCPFLTCVPSPPCLCVHRCLSFLCSAY